MSGEPVPALSRALLDDVYAHAAEGHPEEVCGLILGPRGLLDEVRRCENHQNALHAADPARYPRTARTAYALGGKDPFFVSQSLRGDRPVQIIYHSHVDVGAYFSAEDKAAATTWGEPNFEGIDYLVVDARQDGAHGAKLFRWVGGEFAEIASYPR